jgi:gliding motility-associated-like protein
MYINEEGCDSLVNVSVELRDVPQPMFSLTNPCYLQADGIIEINNSSMSGGATYSIDGVNFQTEPLFDQVSAGVYTIYLNDETCLHEYEVELFDGVELVADQIIPTIECGQTEAELNIELSQAQGAVFYDWSTGGASESITVNEPGYYSLSIYDDCNTLFFEWNIDLETPGLDDIDEFPNIFSPNRDGQNDCLIMSPEFVDRAISYEFNVFDRWGNHVFESFDPSFCWEGLHQGVEAETGVYVWILNYSLKVCDEERFFSKKGDICVVR